MRAIQLHSFVLASVAVLTATSPLAAQERANGLLTNVEVRQLVAREEPAGNARLAMHFSALADRYTAEATRHLTMSRTFVGNPSRNLGAGMSAHCKRLADLNTKEAATLQDLVAYHEKLAAGVAATLSADATKFQAGTGAPEPNAAELNALAAKASTPTEHQALQQYFLALATRYTTAADEHAAFSASYRGTKIAHVSAIHDRLARLAREAAKEATAAAEMHKHLAQGTR